MIAKRTLVAASVCVALGASADAHAVSLSVDNTGQALIFPFYTVQSSSSNPFNTYLSVTNRSAEAKAIRVRFRENRAGREVASFNLFLSPNDVWTGAVIPLTDTAAPRLVSLDRSCTSPVLTASGTLAPGITFSNNFYAGAFNDNLGDGLERTREGWVEMIEMATLTGTSAAAVTQNSGGTPANCAALQGNATLAIAPPTGGLSGTLTLINVASGMDFTVDADALADLSKRSFYRPAVDAYPDLNALEIDPVSVVTDSGFVYRSLWNRGVDAVSAVLLRNELFAEFVLDAGTRSRTDVVVTLPTRQHYQSGNVYAAPFSGTVGWNSNACRVATGGLGTPLEMSYFNRDGSGIRTPGDFGVRPPPPFWICQGATVFEVTNDASGSPLGGTQVLGSPGRGPNGMFLVSPSFANGWMSLYTLDTPPLVSLSGSERTSLATGAVTAGSHQFFGLPMTGLHLRTFENGTLTCSAGACQGNYGGSFPLKYRRVIQLP